MALTSIGDMARHFAGLRNTTALKERLAQLSAEVASGQVADPVAHLNGRSDLLVDLDRTITLRTTEQKASAALGARLDTTQVALDSIEAQRSTLSSDLLALPIAAAPSVIAGAAAKAQAGLETVISALNGRQGGESLFAGTATDSPALAGAGTVMTALRSAVAGATDAADLTARIDSFFDDPAGGFATTVYRGDTGSAATRRIGDLTVTLDPRADAAELKAVMKSLAKAAMAGDPGMTLSDNDRATALRDAGTGLVAAAEGLTATRARLGATQEAVDAATARQGAALSAAKMLRNDLIAADPYEAATALTEVQTRLDTQYAVTARLAGLSLGAYL